MKWMLRLLGLIVALTILLTRAIDGAQAASCGSIPDVAGEFETTSLKQAKLDATILCTLDEKLNARPEANVHAVVVLRDGRLVYEIYRRGPDRIWATKLDEVSYTPSKLHDTRSVSKSVVSLLVGIAIVRELIASVNQRGQDERKAG